MKISKNLLLEAVRASVTVVRPGDIMVIKVPVEYPHWGAEIARTMQEMGIENHFLILPAGVSVFKQED